MKVFRKALAGAVALAFAQIASAQAPTTIAPNSVNVDQQGVQNSNQIGTDNQSTQVNGNDNQTSATQGDQNQNAQGTGNQQSQQYGSGNVNEQKGGTAANEHNRQWGSAAGGASARGDEERHDNGKHKGWYKNGKNDKDGDGDRDRN